ncbi:copper amine oxidase N-terminal domain-containing protein [Alkalihalobacillus oceani]|uniref:copper amine oxidase N-terminal domain-containing protein n=1 Tax=Halalkalibacter oceani TaxID=1653776 RepID=UPI00203D8A00|nr:copper amine oxidase N-terminal domain-containing protein [Halalkalibacter oceani]MCM3760829.1 copper amine oxidase N-terminal domain-containing protein [Halalkalibacter oceani]
MKKMIKVIAASALISGAAVVSLSTVAAEETPEVIEGEEVTQVERYQPVIGKVVETETTEEGLTITVENEENSLITIFPLTDDVVIGSNTGERLDTDSIEEGTELYVFYDRTKPMLMIYPAVIYPEVVIIPDEESATQVKVGRFDENYLSEDKKLQVFINEETVLENKAGEAIEEADLADHEWAVFYDIETKSLPAQTTATKIIALDPIEEDEEYVLYPIDEDSYVENGTTMIALRAAVESFGYEVKWERGTVKISGADKNAALTIGQTAYELNGDTVELAQAPVLKEGKTYVPQALLDELVK